MLGWRSCESFGDITREYVRGEVRNALEREARATAVGAAGAGGNQAEKREWCTAPIA